MDLSVDMETVKQMGLNVEEEASLYKKEVANIYSEIDDLKNNWQGLDSDKYTQQVYSYKETIENLGRVIEEYGTFLLRTSETYTKLQEDIATNAGRL